MSSEALIDLKWVGEPEQGPSGFPIGRQPDLAGNSEPLPADALAEDGPSRRNLTGEVSDEALRVDRDCVRIRLVPRFRDKDEDVVANLGNVALMVAGAFDRSVEGAPSQFEVSRHDAELTDEAVAA
jgi:hypothetical protein